MRFAALSIAVVVSLAAPAAAAAHSRTPTVALDFRLQVEAEPAAGVHAWVIDGDRSLRLEVDPPHRAVVRGLLGEPVLRFAPDGVWANRSSPTARADRLVSGGSGWKRLTPAHAYLWHDHRLSPPPTLRPGASMAWSLPLVVDGRSAKLTGTFTRVARPAIWPWLVLALGTAAALATVAHALPRRRAETAAAAAGIAAAAALAATTAFATGDAIARRSEWIEVASAGVLALFAVAALAVGGRSLRTGAAMIVGVVAAALALGSLSVFRHGVVISSLPASLARLATVVALVGGAGAVVLAVLTPTKGGALR